MKVMHWLRSFLSGQSGQDLLEYGLLLALIAVVCYFAVRGAGSAIGNTFDTLRASLVALPMGAGS